jgi:hypothetical protein
VKKCGCVSVVVGVLLCFGVASAQVKAGGPNGTQSGPIGLYLLYPNYRGYLFDDWSQTVKVDVSVTPPGGYSFGQLQVRLNLLDLNNHAVASTTVAAAADSTVTLDAAGLSDGSYQLQAELLTTAAGVLASPAPAYTIVKLSGATRASMKAYIDPKNVLHYGGRAVFPVGVYDLPNPSCAGTAANWDSNLSLIGKAPITTYLPVSSSNCAVADFTTQTQALQNHGMVDFPALSSTYAGDPYFPYDLATSLGVIVGNPASAQDAVNLASAFAGAMASNKRIVGYYNYDEPTDAQQAMIFNQYQAVRTSDPASVQWPLINIATITWNRPGCLRAPNYAPNGDPPESDSCTDVSNWRDTGDAFGTDPLALNGWNFDANGNYWLPEIQDWVHDLQYATRNARPVWAVLQFYAGESGFPGYPHWPTYQELHDMTYIAVVAGVRGIWYWSWGNLDLPSPDGAPNSSTEVGYLDQVINGLAPLESVILTADVPVLSANSRAGTIITREKAPAGGDRYIFAYNHDGVSRKVTFTLKAAATSVSVVGGENRPVTLDFTHTRFTDSFNRYEAHVYRIKS